MGMGDGNVHHGRGSSTNSNSSGSNRPEWLQQYDLIGKIGEGTYGLVFLAKIKSNRSKSIAIKKFKQSKDGDGVSPTAIREIMASSGNAVPGSMQGPHVMSNRNAPRPMPMGMQRMQQNMAAYNLASQAGMGSGMNPGNIPMQRGVAPQAHQQQQLRRKDPGMGMTGHPPQQKSRRF